MRVAVCISIGVIFPLSTFGTFGGGNELTSNIRAITRFNKSSHVRTNGSDGRMPKTALANTSSQWILLPVKKHL